MFITVNNCNMLITVSILYYMRRFLNSHFLSWFASEETSYINDLPSLCSACVAKLFADDVKVYKRIRI